MNAPQQTGSTQPLAVYAFIALLVCPFVVPIVLGHLSLARLKRTPAPGRGLALTALIGGYIATVTFILSVAMIMLAVFFILLSELTCW